MMIEREHATIQPDFIPPAHYQPHHTRLYQAALIQYAIDAGVAVRGSQKILPDGGEALRDFRGQRTLLAHLCDQAGLNLEWVERKLAQFLMNPPKRLGSKNKITAVSDGF